TKPFGSRSGLEGPQSSLFRDSEFGRRRNLGRSGLNQEIHFDDEEGDASGGMDVDPQPANANLSTVAPTPIYRNPQSAKRAKIDERWANQKHPTYSPKELRPSPRTKPSPIPSIARDIAAKSK